MAELFLRFCADQFKLLLMATRMSETRKKPPIPIALLFLLMVLGLSLGKGSLHQIDYFARFPVLRRLLGTRRQMVGSDSTLERVLPSMNVDEVREELQRAYVRWKQKGNRYTLPTGRKLRVGVLDGSDMRSGFTSALQVKADRGVFLLDAEPYYKDGKELPTTTGLVQRVAACHGKGCLDIVLGDAHHVSAPFWNACRSVGIHVLVKGEGDKKEDLLILREARALIAAGDREGRIETACGVDSERSVSYEVKAVGGLEHDGYNGTVKVAIVTETQIKPRRGTKAGRPTTIQFWVIATDESLAPVEMRELGHLRWQIENNGFRALNDLLGSKRVWTRGKDKTRMFPVLLLLMFLAFNLMSTFEAGLSIEDVQKDLQHDGDHRPHAITLRFVWERVLQTLAGADPLVCVN